MELAWSSGEPVRSMFCSLGGEPEPSPEDGVRSTICGRRLVGRKMLKTVPWRWEATEERSWMSPP